MVEALDRVLDHLIAAAPAESTDREVPLTLQENLRIIGYDDIGFARFFRPSLFPGLGGAMPPSDRLTMGVIGLRPRVMYDLDRFMRQEDVRFVAFADCFAERRAA